MLLTDPLPIRRATEMPQYRSDGYLPWVYGRAIVAPVPLDDAGLEWLLADHPVSGVDRVTVGGAASDGWQHINRLDDAGRAIAVLRLTQPPKDGAALAAHVVGRMHPTTGAPIEHPADIAADLLRQCGWTVTPDAWQGLRDDYPGLALGLVIADPATLREALAAVIEPLGAVWSASPIMARRAGSATPTDTLDLARIDSVECRADSTSIATVARITYARDWSDGRARAALTLAAPDAIAQYGRIAVDIDLPAVRTARDALAICTRRLQDLARPRWDIDVAAVWRDDPWQLGDTITLDHPRAPAGAAMITSREAAHDQSSIRLTLTMPAGPAPRIETLSHSAAIDPAQDATRITYRDGTATFTIADDNGNPLAGAAVTLDGIETRNTDRNGQVQFKTTRGPHTLSVYLAGYAPFTLEVVV